MAHWVWGGGWLAQLGVNFGLGAGFQDGGGAATVHMLGGLSALAVVWIAGSRKGKFPKEGFSTALPGHNAVYVLFGCLLALVGWLAWNVAGAVIWLHAPLASLPVTAINTLLSASGALAATFAVTRFALASPTPACAPTAGWPGWLRPAPVPGSSRRARRSSPAWSLALPRHCWLNCSSWRSPSTIPPAQFRFMPSAASGLVAVASSHRKRGNWCPTGRHRHALGLVLPLVYLLFWLLNRVVPFRVDPDGERIGMDLHELGGGAYPEFVIHRDESYR